MTSQKFFSMTNQSLFYSVVTELVRNSVKCPVGDRLNPKYHIPTIRHVGGNVMVWGCFSHDNVGPIHCIEGIMDQRLYLDTMKNVMLPHGKDKMTCKWILQKDNDPKHCAASVKDYFKSQNIKVPISILLSIFGSTSTSN